MKLSLLDGAILAVFSCSATAQATTPTIPLTSGQDTIHRAIPDELGGGSITRIANFDPDGDLLHDLAILWSNGDVTFCYAPEVLPSFAAAPVAGVIDVATLPAAAVAAAGLGQHDALLLADGATLFGLVYDSAQFGSPTNPTGFVSVPIVSSAAWQQVARIWVHHDGTTCWLLGLDRDQLTVRIGALDCTGIVDLGLATAAATVEDLILMAQGNGGTPQVVARTRNGIEMWSPTGYQLCTPIPAPTPGALGAMCSFRDGTQQRLAWVARNTAEWLLRIYDGSTLQQESDLIITGPVPVRFRPVNIGATALDDSGVDALVLFQNTSLCQTVLAKSTTGDFVPAFAFAFEGVTYGIDECQAIFDDMNNDGRPDFTTALLSQRCVQIAGIWPGTVGSTADAGPGNASGPAFDLLPVDCLFGHSSASSFNDIIRLHVLVPSTYTGDLEAHVVAWPQTVNCPQGTCTGSGSPFGYEPVGQPTANGIYTLTNGPGQIISHPILDLQLPTEPGSSWVPQHHYYFMVRLITRAPGGALLWSSPAQMVGFIAGPALVPEDHNFMNSISTPTNHPVVLVGGGQNRNVGVIHKPGHIDPPPSSVQPPPPSGAAMEPSGSW